MRTEDDMNKMTGNPLIRESRDYRHCGLPQATDHAQATDQSAQEPRVMHCLSWFIFGLGLELALHANRG
jgi:hypothetical protein